MNVFGAFTFGSLIKTFIPGLVWVVAFAILWQDLHAHYPQTFAAIPSLSGEEQNALVLAIPAAILCGLVSNIVVFMGVNDWLVRHPVRSREPELFRLFDALGRQVRDHHWERMQCPDATLRDGFLRHADPELLILGDGLERLAYVREQYWFHMEFQVNMLLATVCLLLALIFDTVLPADARWFAALGLGLFCLLLHRAAVKNYTRHVAKMATLMAGALAAAAAEGQPSPQGTVGA